MKTARTKSRRAKSKRKSKSPKRKSAAGSGKGRSAKRVKSPRSASRAKAKTRATKPKRRVGGPAATVSTFAAALADPPGMSCSNGWHVTGYYTPVEADFSGAPQQIQIQNVGTDNFPGDFLSAVRMEGWGQTRHGWYLGYYSSRYHKSDNPLNRRGQPLRIGSLAVDEDEIAIGSQVRIINLPAPWNNQLFIADDVGGAIQDKHVDVYCGLGRTAQQETYRVTGGGRRLCQN